MKYNKVFVTKNTRNTYSVIKACYYIMYKRTISNFKSVFNVSLPHPCNVYLDSFSIFSSLQIPASP